MHRLVLMSFLASALAASAASAQQQQPATTAEASAGEPAPGSYEDLIRRGEAAVIGADWNACVQYFTQAHAMRASEVTYLAIGRCALERGDYVDALRHLQEGMRYSLTERQRVSVENLKARARQHLGRYRLELSPPNASVTISGQPVAPDSDGYIWLKVGRYPIAVSAPGHETVEGELVVGAGDDGKISYSLPAVAPTGPGPGPGQAAPPEADSGERDGKFPVVPVVIAGVGGAMIVASVVTGVLALGDKSDLDDKCTLGPNGDRCDPSVLDTRDSAETLSLVTDILWIGGAVAVATGAVLYFVQADDGEAAVQVNAAVGPSGAGLLVGGRF